MSRGHRWAHLLFLGAAWAGAALAQDTRQVSEPVLPPACAVLVAEKSGPDTALADDAPRIQAAIEHCAPGLSVRLAPTNQYNGFVAGPLKLASGVTLVVEAGATLYASSDAARYDRGRGSCGRLDDAGKGCMPFISAADAQHIGIMGEGIIDGQGGERVAGRTESWWQMARRAQREKREHNTPRLIEIDRSSDVTLYRITLRNAPNFHVALHQVDGFTAWGVRIDTPATARNTDGIDPISSRNVTITRSYIRTGDDNVAIKAGSAGPTEFVSVIDNHFYSGHGMSIGSETQGGVRHVLVQDLSLDGTTSGLRVKSDPTRGGRVGEVLYRRVCLRDVPRPIEVSSRYEGRSSGALVPLFDGLRYEDVHALTPGAVSVQGHDEGSLARVAFRRVVVAGGAAASLEHAALLPGSEPLNPPGVPGLDCTQRFAAFALPAAPRNPRPQLSAAQARQFAYAQVLGHAGPPGRERPDPWDPLADALVEGASPRPDYTVDPQAAADGVRVFRTVQAAVDRAVKDARAAASTARIHIRVRPGTYRELVYVPAGPAPITLEGDGATPADTVITARLDAAVTGTDYAQQYAAQFAGTDPAIQAMFDSVRERATLGTFGTPTVWVRNAGFQARKLSIVNAYQREAVPAPGACVDDCRAPATPAPPVQHQAVALMVDGADRAQFEQVRLAGLQDTLYLKAQADGSTARSFFHRSTIEGDVDFIFGNATAFFYRSEIRTLGSRRNAYVGAPDTNVRTRYGLVFDDCDFTSDGSAYARAGNYNLSRQWFHDQRCTPFGAMAVPGYGCTFGPANGYTSPRGTFNQAVLETVGKMVVLHSRIGSHIHRTHPWADWNQSGKLSYRPAQLDSDDYWANLRAIGIDPVAQLGYAAQPAPAEVFEAEFENVVATDPARGSP